jgi:hypothetical protein
MEQCTVHLEKPIVAHLVKKISSSIEAEVSLRMYKTTPLTETNISSCPFSGERMVKTLLVLV